MKLQGLNEPLGVWRAAPFLFETENRALNPVRPGSGFELNSPSLEKHDPLHIFKQAVSRIPQVDKVLFSYQPIPDNRIIIHLFTVIGPDDKAVRRQIYVIEHQLMKRFPKDHYDFNFHVLASRGKPLANLPSATKCSVLFERRVPE